MIAWTTVEMVKAHLGVDPADTIDDLWLQAATEAACGFVAQQRPDLPAAGSTFMDYPQMVTGTTMLAARWYRRRNADGEAGFDAYGPYPTSGLDKDVRAMLGLDRPVVA